VKRILIVAYHFPPAASSTGWQRAYYFAKYLPRFGWNPIVLSAALRAYETVDPLLANKAREGGCILKRAFALDAARHFSIFGRYPGWVALPDRWSTWITSGTLTGLMLIRKYAPRAILSTFPIPSSLVIGWALKKITGIPWVVDLRDPILEHNYPTQTSKRFLYSIIERRVVRMASRVTFNAPSAMTFYVDRFPKLEGKVGVVYNGFDADDISNLKANIAQNTCNGYKDEIVLTHAGLVYKNIRNPEPLMKACAYLKQSGEKSIENFRIRFIGSGDDAYFVSLANQHGVADIFEFIGRRPFADTLQQLSEASALLLLQGKGVGYQIPAKIYEYMNFQKPILALTSDDGDAATVLRSVGGASFAQMEDESSIADALPNFLGALRQGTHPVPDKAKVKGYSWKRQVEKLAAILADVDR